MQRTQFLYTTISIWALQGTYAMQMVRRMKSFIHRALITLPFEKLWVKYNTNLNVVEKLGGILTYRSNSNVHPIPNFIKNISVLFLAIPSNLGLHHPHLYFPTRN
jgi:hypothetical protein